MGKAEQEGPVREFVFDEWLREGIEGMVNKTSKVKPAFDFGEFYHHIRNAQKEQLLALRSLLDKAIERLEEEEQQKK